MLVIECLALDKKLQSARDFYHRSEFQQAKIIYQNILREFSNTSYRTDILYNLALCCIATEEVILALQTLEKILAIKPNHVNALNNMGALLLQQQKTNEALQCFSAVITIDPEHPEARHNLAALLLQNGQYKQAVEQYEYILEKTPQDINSQYHYAAALLESGKIRQSITAFKTLLQSDSTHLNAKINLGIAYLKSGNSELAETLFKDVLDKNPNLSEIRFLYAALSQTSSPEKPPSEYITHLFNQYASYYDQHMLEALHYQVPDLLLELFSTHSHSDQYQILDLGCGTGLSGLSFQKIARSLTGVDLSSKMLQKAAQKNIYTDLIEMDLQDYLHTTSQKYDLVISADTFNYFGSLSFIFKHIQSVLSAQGMVLFSIETDSTPGSPNWSLKSCARYAHTKSYIEALAEDNNFKIIEIQTIMLREQNHKPQIGFIVLFQKGITP
jgi:predicted TPR repeat methyltransferase